MSIALRHSVSTSNLSKIPGYFAKGLRRRLIDLIFWFRCHLHCKPNVGCAIGGAFASQLCFRLQNWLLVRRYACVPKKLPSSVGGRELWPHRSLHPFPPLSACPPLSHSYMTSAKFLRFLTPSPLSVPKSRNPSSYGQNFDNPHLC